MKIEMGPSQQAFYKGVAAASKAAEAMNAAAAQRPDTPFQDQLNMFWLMVGRASVEVAGDEEAERNFLIGATTRAPQRTDAFTLEIRTAGAAFRDESVEEEDDDGTARSREVERLLRRAALNVADMYTEHVIIDANGAVVGSWQFHG